MAEPDRLQLGKPLAAVGAAEVIENWSLTSFQQRLVKTAAGWSSTPAITGYYWRRAI